MVASNSQLGIRLSLLRLLATLGVIIIHVSDSILAPNSPQFSSSYLIALTFGVFARPLVPIFFMISGYWLLLKEDETLKNTFTRLIKIVIPFIAASLFYYLFKGYIFGIDLSFVDFLKRLISNDIYYHLWFLYHLAGVYLLVPLFQAVINYKHGRNILKYFVIVWITSSIVTTIGNWYGLPIGVPLGSFLGNIGYFVLGYLLFTSPIVTKKSILIVSFLGYILVCFLTSYVRIYLSIQSNRLLELGFLYDSPFIIVSTTFVAIFLFNITEYMRSLFILKIFEPYLLWVYLIHVFFLEIAISTKEVSIFTSQLMNQFSTGKYILTLSFILLLCSFISSIVITESGKFMGGIVKGKARGQ